MYLLYGVNSEQAILLRNNTSSASGQINLTHEVFCYSHVSAYDIEVNSALSSLTVQKNLNSTMADIPCSGDQQ